MTVHLSRHGMFITECYDEDASKESGLKQDNVLKDLSKFSLILIEVT